MKTSPKDKERKEIVVYPHGYKNFSAIMIGPYAPEEARRKAREKLAHYITTVLPK